MRRFGLVGLLGVGVVAAVSLLSIDKEEIDTNVKLGATAGLVVEPNEVEYDSRFDEYDLKNLRKSGVEPEVANQYDSVKFNSGWKIGKIVELGVKPEIANLFHERVHFRDIMELNERGVVNPSVVNPYAEAFSIEAIGGMEIAALVNSGTSVEITQEWRNLDFSDEDNSDWYDSGKFNWEQIAKLHGTARTPKEAKLYDPSFTPESVFRLMVHETGPNEANGYAELNSRYGARISGEDIVRYGEERITFGQVEEQAKKSWLESSVRD